MDCDLVVVNQRVLIAMCFEEFGKLFKESLNAYSKAQRPPWCNANAPCVAVLYAI